MPSDRCEVVIQRGLHRVAEECVCEGIDPAVDNGASFTSYTREISTAPPSPTCRCIANKFKLTQTYLSFL